MTSLVGLCWRINHILAPILQFEDAFVGEQFLFRNMGPIRQWWWLCGPAFGPFCPPSKTVDQTSSLFPTMPRCELTRAPFDNWLLIATIFPHSTGTQSTELKLLGLVIVFYLPQTFLRIYWLVAIVTRMFPENMPSMMFSLGFNIWPELCLFPISTNQKSLRQIKHWFPGDTLWAKLCKCAGLCVLW